MKLCGTVLPILVNEVTPDKPRARGRWGRGGQSLAHWAGVRHRFAGPSRVPWARARHRFAGAVPSAPGKGAAQPSEGVCPRAISREKNVEPKLLEPTF